MTLRPARLAALVTTVGLAAGTLLVAPATTAVAAEPNDSAAAISGGDWLVGQLEDDVLVNDEFDFTDYALTIDLGFALDAVSGDRYDATLADVTDAVTTAEAVSNYTSFDDSDTRFAGATAKLASFVQQRLGDPRDVGGVDLIDELEGLTTDSGRIIDRSTFGDSANVLGQGYAARALTVAGSTEAAAATSFLLDQQCSEGFFRSAFSPASDADQTCDGASNPAADVDATALSLLNLQAIGPDAGTPAAQAIEDGVAWLLDAQNGNGSFSAAAPATAVQNSNSTGLAAQALAGAGEEDAATAAAAWIAGRQVSSPARCGGALVPDQIGAVAYSSAALELGRDEGIVTSSRDQWRRASTQAVPALRYLGARTPSADLSLSTSGDDTRYVPAGSTQRFTVTALADGQTVCLVGPGAARSLTQLSGDSVLPETTTTVRLPQGTGTRVYSLVGTDESVSIDALAAKKLAVRLAKGNVVRGANQTVTVRDLAPREEVTVRLRGRVVDTGVATQQGFFRSTFRVAGRTGQAPVKVVGQFGTRSGTASFRVR